MELVTLKQFAEEKGITYEAVRRQILKYADELEGHIVTVDGTRYLDEEAQKFLSERRRLSPIVVKIEDTQADNKEILEKIESLKTQLLKAQERVIQLQDEARAGIEDKIKYQLLIADHEEQKKRLREVETTLQEKQSELDSEKETRRALQNRMEEQSKQLDDLRAEASTYERTWFGFYRKRTI